MKTQLEPHAVRLEFDEELLVHANLSGAAFVGNELWVAGDEACGLDRLQALPQLGAEQLRFGQGIHFPLADYLDLPDAADIEADIEGLDFHGGYLWLVGSHGLKRKAPRAGYSEKKNLERLATVSSDGNRCLLARIPVIAVQDGNTLSKHTPEGLSAARLRGNTLENDLSKLLKKDRHYGAYLAIPGKDNGFDIEGLAVCDERILLGLRGPVLRGWAGLLEIRSREQKGELRLDDIAQSDEKLRKHFLNLAGLGIRDLHWSGDDLIILAGPTMALDGAIRVFRWPDAAQAMANVDPSASEVLWETGPIEMLSLPYGAGQDRAEAITALPSGQEQQWLVLYDAPSAQRKLSEQTVLGDLITFKQD
ncbi:DUF3616 domain-containing protein [Chitinibacter sp. FCG-7]|uniref:DUF3616 domain-containing protein n=1 Tax=Chitinibacter mangrovi TaxID=3153927 RepID=A0AAU7FA21_9NEIS